MVLQSSNQSSPALARWTTELVIAELEAATATLRALRCRGYSTKMASLRLEIPPDDWPAEPSDGVLRPAIPNGAAIDHMDRVLAWIAFVPEDRRVLRRIVGLRARTSLAGKPMAWRAIGREINASPIAAKEWHAAAIEIISRRLNASRISPR